MFMRAPEVKLGRSAVNAQVEFTHLGQRWPLALGGAPGGPSTVLWFYAMLLVLGGLAISRLGWSPLRPWQWALLALGLTQSPPWLAAAVLGWPLAIHRRGRAALVTPWQRNSCQLAILLVTGVVVAGLVALIVVGLTRGPDAMLIDSSIEPNTSGWYVDRISSALPRPWVISVPQVAWNCLNLAWVLWLGWSLRKWGPWAWASVRSGGLWAKTDLPWRRRGAFAPAFTPSEPRAEEDASADTTSEAKQPADTDQA